YLTSKKVQEMLNEIGMLSCFYKVEYQNEHLRDMQSKEGFATVSAFTSEENLKEMQRLAKLAIVGNEDAKIKIKNMLI
ncbi:MAG: hypothetical protein IJX16_04400, partial [Clostridia bacterium]|nr:hypothetical protein [Clostridia bacterium]